MKLENQEINNIKERKLPICKDIVVFTYTVVEEARKHTEYTPATELESLTDMVMEEVDANVDETLVTTDEGVPEQDVAAVITNACASPPTFTSPIPLASTDWTTLVAGMMDGLSEEKTKMLIEPAVKYGEDVVNRVQR